MRRLSSRRAEGVIARRARVSIGDWQPQRHWCHDNVKAWVAARPDHKHVFGYLIFDHRLLLGCWTVTAHSLVENEHGELVDITPTEASKDYPFVRHFGSEDQFAAMATAIN